jgi:2,3-bisphosphoglycerate-independent phosphoglycerate mutase
MAPSDAGGLGGGLPPGPTELPVTAVCLVVLDGWGLAPDGPGNAISLANTPVFDELWRSCPHTQLTACGRAVGLPEGQMGNSEVGHLNLGAGAVVRQDLTRIDDAIADGTFMANQVLREAMTNTPRVHLIGLVSDGGVHSGWTHLRALIQMADETGVEDLVLHAFTDGRDTPPTAGAGYLETAATWMHEAGAGRVGSVIGRYYAMDRDHRWDRIQQAYDLLVHGTAQHHSDSGSDAVRAAYERGETDEFITATTVGAQATIRPGDSVVAFNFRPDRMRQLTLALTEPGFAEIDRRGAAGMGVGGLAGEEIDRHGAAGMGEGGLAGGKIDRHGAAGRKTGGLAGEEIDRHGRVGVPIERYTCMTEYEEGWPHPVAFPPERPQVTLSGVLAERSIHQLHVAETEKYPHVTYFFNGGEEAPYPGERRELVPSPRDVPTYDHKPQMSAPEAARAFVKAWQEDGAGGFRFAIINFANADMVGHTGVIPAAVSAVETVDACLKEVLEAVHASGGACIVTADHGNAEHMLEPDGSPNTAHSLNPVPLIVTVPGLRLRQAGGILADVAPTVLHLLGLSQPPAMTGVSLIENRP